MILYYAPGACSLADHIALHEAGISFELRKVDLKSHKLEDGRSFLDINPKGYVPALQLDDGEVLTENVAVLSYIADQYPDLDAAGQLGVYRRLEMLAYLAAELHKAFHPLFDPAATDAEKKSAGENVGKKLAFIASKLTQPYLLGTHFTVSDAYLFVMLMWAAKNKLDVPGTLKAYSERIKSRPAVQMALKHEGLV